MEFPGSLVIRTLCFHCSGEEFNLRSHKERGTVKERKRKEIKYQIHCMVLDYLNETALKENVVLFGEI